MSLNGFARGFPEQTIEQAIASIPFFIRQCRSEEARRPFHYQNPEDFVLGVTIGSIVTSFETAFKIANSRHFNQNEISEINKVINARCLGFVPPYLGHDDVDMIHKYIYGLD